MDPNHHHNALNRNDRLHWYEIQSILGQGGFGITYLARDTNLDQLVAIKEYLPSEFSTRDQANTVQPISENHTEIFDWGKKRFLDEARTLAQFRHPNVVRVSSFFENNNTGYMVMDYEDGTDLSKFIKAGESFDEQRLLGLILPVLDGLEKIHAQGFIHRDIKPANIFVRTDGSPVLIDFGSARQAIGEQTRTMTSLVTPGYAPFEQYHDADGKQGPWTDIYSLGATCYCMLTGKPPIDALKRGMARIDHSTDAYLRLTDLRLGDYTEHLLQAIDHALEFRETDRPQNVTDWSRMLRGEMPVPQSSIPTRLGASASAFDTVRDGNTQLVTGPDDPTMPATKPVTAPNAASDPPPAPPTSGVQPRSKPGIDQSPGKPRSGAAKSIGIAVAIIAVSLIAIGLYSRLQPPAPMVEAPSAVESPTAGGSDEQARLAAEEEALRKEQARIDAEAKKLTDELAAAEKQARTDEETKRAVETQARLEAEQRLEQQRAAEEAARQERLRIAAEEDRQAELAAREEAEKKRLAELAAQEAAEEKRRQALAASQAETEKRLREQALREAARDPYANISGVYLPDDGFERLTLLQLGDRISGEIGSRGSTLEGRREGNTISFTLNYSRTGYGFKEGYGQFTISADGRRLTGFRSEAGFPPNSNWSFRRRAN